MRIVVRGIPAPQGSKRAFPLKNGKVTMVESSRAVGPWREAVRAETQRAWTAPISKTSAPIYRLPYDGPVSVILTFSLPRPASTPKRIKHPAKRPDLDKLVRSTLDGLTAGGAWRDDAQVVRLLAYKQFAGDEGTGCQIDIEEAL